MCQCTDRNILEDSYYLVKDFLDCHSGSADLLLLIKIFQLKEAILYSQSGKSGKCQTKDGFRGDDL